MKTKLWQKLVALTKHSTYYFWLYKSYWYANYRQNVSQDPQHQLYFSAIPNLGAGIGHQMANWISGYWFAQFFNLKFAHTSFSNPEWESFLGFHQGEESLIDVCKKKKYKKIKLPLFDENNRHQVNAIKKIIQAYSGKKVVFIAEQDQFYFDQFGVREKLQEKFYSNPLRAQDDLIFDENSYNIAIHVRRGDISIGQLNHNPNLLMRWQNNDYFVNALGNALEKVNTIKPINIYLFSQGKKEDFKEFKQFSNITYCLDMNAQDSFLHMVYADMLITSKSSFSYKPALINKNIIISPKTFWHGYPVDKKWWLTDENGNLINTDNH